MKEQTQSGPAWASRGGFLQVPTGVEGQVGSQDRAAIAETMYRYAWGYDERALDVLESVFTVDAIVRTTVADVGSLELFEGRTAILSWLEGHMAEQLDQRRHCVLNHVITPTSKDEVGVIAYLLLTAVEGEVVRLVTTGVYRMTLVRDRKHTWLIRHMFAGFDAAF